MKPGQLYQRHQKKTMKRFLLQLLLCLIVAIILGVLMSVGLAVRPEIVIFGFLSFAGTMLVVMILAAIIGVMQHFILRKNYLPVLKNCSNKRLPEKVRLDAHAQIQSLDDPQINKLSNRGLVLGVFCLSTWIIILLVVSFGAYVFKNNFFINLLENFK
ncbi:MAG TPA: hypothetical protein HPP87_03235 [Planctomycetes bacterium]|nr:hypothetical protein [Planctomycetota bacterium]